MALTPLVVGADAAAAAPLRPGSRPDIAPREAWANGRAPRGALAIEEAPRFLLVHHTATSNTYDAEGVARQLQSVFAFHTGPERAWPDVAYNFIVDRFGGIWEGRQGSLAGPVRGDASGGSQGFAQLCCFLGDFAAAPPPPAAMDAMAALLAWLAQRDGIDLGAPVTFTSRGSNRWARGVDVTTDAVAAHRDMSLTACPGDALYPLVRTELAPAAAALLAPAPAPTPTPTPTPTSAPAGGAVSSTASTTPATSAVSPTAGAMDPAAATPAAGGGHDERALWVGTGLGVTAVGALAVRASQRRRLGRGSSGGSATTTGSAGEEPDRQREPAPHQRGGQADEEASQGQ
nr:N-acetylmuramoyl-L-alanine amidase [Propioniciclava soli]